MRIACALSLLLLAGCSRPRGGAQQPASALQGVVNGLSSQGDCGRVIPSQWSPSWPVPVIEGGQLAYRLFYFGRDGDPQHGFRFHQAEADAEFTPAGRVLACARRPQPGAPLPAASGGSRETIGVLLEKERQLYSSTENVAALFAAGKPLTDDEKKHVADFAAAFADRSETGHAAAYRALNPEFWSWVEKNGGRAPVP